MKLLLSIACCSEDKRRSTSLCDINFSMLGLFLLAVSPASLHVLPVLHSLCLPVTLFSSWLAYLSSKVSAADVNGPRQHVLFATCTATHVTMGEVLFSFFPGHLFTSASVVLLIFHTLKVYYIFFPFESLMSSMQRTCPVQQNYASLRLLQHCLCNHFAELCYSRFYLAT